MAVIVSKVERWIRFGHKSFEQIIDRRCSLIGFAPESIFAFVRWASNDYGTIVSRLDILRAVRRGEPYQTVPFVRPGGEILLRIDGWPKVQRVLALIDAVAPFTVPTGSSDAFFTTADDPVIDPLGRIYNHRHPQGYWMPGAASNTGAAWISAWFSERDLGELDRLAAGVIPTGEVTYPLVGMGERFPFVAADAVAFGYAGSDEEVRYASALEGVAYLERMAFDLVEELSGERVEAVSTAGGGSAGDTWLRIRANVLDRPVRKVRNANAASGAAMIAASGCWYPGLIAAVDAMVELEAVIEPGNLVEAYAQGYRRFRNALTLRGYVV